MRTQRWGVRSTLRALDRDANSVITYQLTAATHVTARAEQPELRRSSSRWHCRWTTSRSGSTCGSSPRPRRHARTPRRFINVIDANTHRPVFQSSHYTVSTARTGPVGTSIATISATDEDTGENARITYVLEDPCSVPHRPDTGTIYTMTELDYEDQAAYTLAITARDNGIPQKSDTTSLEILILDANDNATLSAGISIRAPSRGRARPPASPSRSLPPIGTQAPMAACCTPSRVGMMVMGTFTSSPRRA